MNLTEARHLLGPIRTYWDRQLDRWCLDGKPATHKEIIREAESTWDRMSHRARVKVLSADQRTPRKEQPMSDRWLDTCERVPGFEATQLLFHADLMGIPTQEVTRYCHRCGVTFVVVESFARAGETTICATPGCGWLFQHGRDGTSKKTFMLTLREASPHPNERRTPPVLTDSGASPSGGES